MSKATEDTVDAGTRPPTASATDETVVSEDGAPGGGTGAGAEPGQGTIIGRYVALSKLGAGAMGVVLAAYDPELDRKVAVKLLRMRGTQGSDARARLQREAQALAKLNHANVVGVHDVGVHEGQVFVAMEFVQGQTLGEWMGGRAGTPRPWRAVLELFVAAGRGLAAAHAQGLIHRDFKPDNVMIGDDGRVRVMDFGLARADDDDEAPPAPADLAALEAVDGILHTPLTRTGAMMGTPAYMAPEQFTGGRVTARSDQFSFFVALYEALFGQAPFRGETIGALAFNVAEGQIRELPRGSRVPAWLRKVVLRGLSADPEDRFASMPEVVAALGSGEARRRRTAAFAGVAAIGVLGAGVVGLQRHELGRRVTACEAEGGRVDEIWNDDSRQALHAGLVATGVSYAPTVADKVVPWVDRQADAWRKASTTACMNASVHETWDTMHLDRAQWCLEERRLELSTYVSQMAHADEAVVQKAVQAAAGLSPVVTCLDETSLAGMGDPPASDLRPRVAEVREALSRAAYLQSAGKYDEGLDVVRSAQEQAQALAWPPLTAAARAREAGILLQSGKPAEAEEAGTTAFFDAAASNTWHVAAAAALDLVHGVGYAQARHAEGEQWARHMDVAIHHAGDPLGLLEANRANNLGTVYYAKGDHERAAEMYSHALEMFEEALGPEHLDVAAAANNLAAVREASGDHDEAQALYTRALDSMKAALGPQHPDVATAMNNLGSVLRSKREYDEAQALFDGALEIFEGSLGPEHPLLATTLNNLGVVHEARGEYAQSMRAYERALPIWEKALGPGHPQLAASLNNLGNLHRKMGDCERAMAQYERVLPSFEEAFGPEHPNVAYPLTGLGVCLHQLGRPGAAVEKLERAVTLRSGEGVAPVFVAQSRFALAEALWDAPDAQSRDKARAVALAEQARDAYRGEGEASADALAKVEAWLAERGGAGG